MMTIASRANASMITIALLAALLLPVRSALPQDMTTYYTVMHPEEFAIDWTGFYEQATRDTAATRERLPHHLDLAYGQHPKQRLDLYRPRKDTDNAPVFLFLHGGGFQEGDRAQYGFVASSLATRGVITAVASYRLANQGHSYPAQSDDARDAVSWLHENVAEYGGNPRALYVGGHSAGAILAADLGADRGWLESRGIPPDSLRGIVPISGTYDLRPPERPGYVDAYAPTPESRQLASPILHIDDPAPIAVVAVGSREPQIIEPSEAFAEALSTRGVHASFIRLEDQAHDGTVLSLADESGPLFRRILDMMNRAPAPQGESR